MTQNQLQQATLRASSGWLDSHQVLIQDAGASLADLQAAKVKHYVVRLPLNCTARRNQLPSRRKKGRPPEYGRLIRPLPRTYRSRTVPATPPEVKTAFTFQGRTIRVEGWHNLVRTDQKAVVDHETFTIWVFFDPLYHNPLGLATNLEVRPETVFRLYLDRWSVEQVPLVTKQLLGIQRQFVFAQASRHRLPQLALLAANVLTYQAALLPPLPTGFWDRQPKRTPGRLRRVLAKVGFPKDLPLGGQIRKKQSVTGHLPKGVMAHRRKMAAS